MAQEHAGLTAQPTALVLRHTIWVNRPLPLVQPELLKSYLDT